MSPEMENLFVAGFNARPAAHSCGGGRWKPLEIGAMVVGFALYWPIGLAILGWKFWQKQSGYQGDPLQFLAR